jgi:hypothetical protein
VLEMPVNPKKFGCCGVHASTPPALSSVRRLLAAFHDLIEAADEQRYAAKSAVRFICDVVQLSAFPIVGCIWLEALIGSNAPTG